MTAASICPDCGAGLLLEARRGVCPTCFLRRALAPSPANEAEDDSPGSIYLLQDRTTSPLTRREFGDYELLEEIGHGGMGVIFKARQRSLDRIVALKLIRSGSLAKPADIARFRTEAGAAARLQHSNIVAIYEVGEHEGQHFYSMEFIPGHSLAEELRRAPLSPYQAARLLQAVAEAIHFAHQRGVLHRDLKPSNILLDAEGSPCVADFGLAKILQSDSELTLSGAVLGSPQYMPPEQARGRSARADERSDVYSLGAILYESLTGHAPFSAATALETMKLVVDEQPIAPRALNPALPRDLETIALKCLAKAPGARYRSAQDLCDELGRFLRHEPIRARPVSPAERAWRWCRRKPATATMAGATLLLAIGGFLSVTWQWRQARAHETAQRVQAAKNQQVIHFLQQTINGAGLSVAEGRDRTLPHAILNQTAARVAAELKNQPEVEAEVRSALGGVYQVLGDDAQAEKMHRQALALYRQCFGLEHSTVAVSLHNLGSALYGQGRLTEAATCLRESVAMGRRLFGGQNLTVASSLNDLANVLRSQGEMAEAEAANRQALAVRRKLADPGGPELITSLGNLALVLQRQGKLDEAESLFREALTLLRQLSAADPAMDISLSGLIRQQLAATLAARQALPEARALAEEAVALYQRHADWPARDHQHALRVLGGILATLGDATGLETVYEASLELSRQPLDNEDPQAISSLRTLARVLRKAGKIPQAQTLFREAVERYSRAGERGDVGALGGAAWLLATCPDPDVRDGPRAILLAEKAVEATHRKDANLLDTLAASYAAAGDFAKAVMVQEEAVALLHDEATKAAFSERLKLYRSNQPCVD